MLNRLTTTKCFPSSALLLKKRLLCSSTLIFISSPYKNKKYINNRNNNNKLSYISYLFQSTNISDNPYYSHASRKHEEPIKTGRKWNESSKKKPGTLYPEEIEDPFEGKALPFGRKLVFENASEHELAKGKYWIPGIIDRFSEFQDYDIIERGWAGYDFWRMTYVNRVFEDLTSSHDINYHYKIHNWEAHLSMVRYIPHLKPLLPELKIDFDNITTSWQDICKEVLEDDNDTGESESEISEESERVVTYDGTTLIKKRKYSKEIVRRNELARDLKKITIKRYVDDCVEQRDFVRLIFIDAIGTKHYVYGMVGETLLQACRRYNVPIDAWCSGGDRGHVRVYGIGAECGQCQMDISPKYFKFIPPYDWREKQKSLGFRTITPYSRLGCCIWIRPEFDGMVVSIPLTLFIPHLGPQWELGGKQNTNVSG